MNWAEQVEFYGLDHVTENNYLKPSDLMNVN